MSIRHSFLKKSEIAKIVEKKGIRMHFIGALGVGMRGLVELCRNFDILLTTSDKQATSDSEIAGIPVLPHRRENVACADIVVASLAVGDDNEELLEAQRLGIPVISRAELLGVIMPRYGERIGISGSHGKSTTTAMLGAIFVAAGLSPTVLCGAALSHFGSPLLLGDRDTFVYEACEYCDSFLYFSPTASLFISLELDHTDYFKDLSEIKASFLKAMNMPTLSVVNIDDENLSSLIPRVEKRCITFGESPGADYRISNLREICGRYSFTLVSICLYIAQIIGEGYACQSFTPTECVFSYSAKLFGNDKFGYEFIVKL